jgi:dihydrofolate reductase
MRARPVVERRRENIGAVVMGRNMFGGGPGPWGDDQWNGFWGEEPPYHAPVFVLTHHAREPQEMEGGTTFHFITDGIESALEQAKEASGGKDVSLAAEPR